MNGESRVGTENNDKLKNSRDGLAILSCLF